MIFLTNTQIFFNDRMNSHTMKNKKDGPCGSSFLWMGI